jgi:hypothetical protein
LNRRIRRILWILGFAFVLHELEEWNLVSWQQANFEPPPQFTDREARTLLILFALLGISFTALCNWLLSLRVALVALLPLFVAIIFGNALTHIFWLFYFQTYSPGVVTSAFVLVPLTLLLVREVLQEHLVPPHTSGCFLHWQCSSPLPRRSPAAPCPARSLPFCISAPTWHGGCRVRHNKPMKRTSNSAVQMTAVLFRNNLVGFGDRGGAIQRRLSPIR